MRLLFKSKKKVLFQRQCTLHYVFLFFTQTQKSIKILIIIHKYVLDQSFKLILLLVLRRMPLQVGLSALSLS